MLKIFFQEHIAVIHLDLKLFLEFRSSTFDDLRKKTLQIIKDAATSWQTTCKTHSVQYDLCRPVQLHSSSSLNHFEESHFHSLEHEYDSCSEGHGHSHNVHHN